MMKEIEIPTGYEARIEGNKVVIAQKESEDERMVRIIEDVICTNEGEAIAQKYDLKLTDLADWLEKQKEQKSAEWSEEDGKHSAFIVAALDAYNRLRKDNNNSAGQEEFDKAVVWFHHRFKSIRPQPKVDIDAIAKREYERGKWDGYWEGYNKL